MSVSPPPSAMPINLQPIDRIPQPSGWPRYLKGKVPSGFGGPSSSGDQRCMSIPPGTPRMLETYTVPSWSTRLLGSSPRTMNFTGRSPAVMGRGSSWLGLNWAWAKAGSERADKPTRPITAHTSNTRALHILMAIVPFATFSVDELDFSGERLRRQREATNYTVVVL